MATSIRDRIARVRGAEALRPRACAIAGLLVGLLAGWFGLAAGLLLGFMLDIARAEARARRLLTDFFRYPDGPSAELLSRALGRALGRALPGYAEAACIALRGEWPGPADPEARRMLWDRLSAAALPLGRGPRREAERTAEVASRCSGADLPALARRLATSEGADRARKLLADWAFASSALGRGSLDSSAELELRASLGDCGVGAREILAARLACFPDERDPWTVLGLAPGAPRSEVKRAYRRLSRAFHPDAARGADGERFREVCEAYADLSKGGKRE
jgi:hypothetical protein